IGSKESPAASPSSPSSSTSSPAFSSTSSKTLAGPSADAEHELQHDAQLGLCIFEDEEEEIEPHLRQHEPFGSGDAEATETDSAGGFLLAGLTSDEETTAEHAPLDMLQALVQPVRSMSRM
ncbi:unnamed protein product, partial [Amoebophrya sp. A25]